MYFDVRDCSHCWVGIELTKGHMIVVPAGMCHHFTLDSMQEISTVDDTLINVRVAIRVQIAHCYRWMLHACL